VRICLGSGSHPWPGFINADKHGDPDIKTDAMNLSMFKSETVDEIHAIHLFEHIPRLDVDAAVAEWRRVLKPGGLLALEMPSLDKMAKMIVAGEKNIRLTLLGLFGDPRDERPGMMHQWAYGEDELREILVGFEVTFKPPVFHIEARDQRVEARKL